MDNTRDNKHLNKENKERKDELRETRDEPRSGAMRNESERAEEERIERRNREDSGRNSENVNERRDEFRKRGEATDGFGNPQETARRKSSDSSVSGANPSGTESTRMRSEQARSEAQSTSGSRDLQNEGRSGTTADERIRESREMEARREEGTEYRQDDTHAERRREEERTHGKVEDGRMQSNRDHIGHRENNLKFLNDVSGYKVASDDPDVRGWQVVDANERVVGKVDNLLVDVSKKRVRYLDVDLNREMIESDKELFSSNANSKVHEYMKSDGDVHMIVPIGLARLDRSNKKVISDEINRNTLAGGHVHRSGENITPDYESRVLGALRTERRGNRNTDSLTGETDPNRRAEYGTPRNKESNDDTGFRRGSSERGASGVEEYSRGSAVPQQQRTEGSENAGRTGFTGQRKETQGTDFGGKRADEGRYEKSTAPNTARDESPIHGSSSEAERSRSRRDENKNDDFYENEYFDERRFYGRK